MKLIDELKRIKNRYRYTDASYGFGYEKGWRDGIYSQATDLLALAKEDGALDIGEKSNHKEKYLKLISHLRCINKRSGTEATFVDGWTNGRYRMAQDLLGSVGELGSKYYPMDEKGVERPPGPSGELVQKYLAASEFLDELTSYLYFRRGEKIFMFDIRRDFTYTGLSCSELATIISNMGWDVDTFSKFRHEWFVIA